jgi:periplasmic copper chaperone A
MIVPAFPIAKRGLALAAFLLLASCNAATEQPDIAVEGAWARAAAEGQTSSAAYFTIRNRGGEDRLLSASSPVGETSIHETSIEDGVMRMRPLESLEIPANSTVALEPHGMHIMLMGLQAPLETGATVPIELTFERAGPRQVEAEVRPATGHGH